MGGRADNLWIGDLESYMDENFVRMAFSVMGETVLSIRVFKEKYGQRLGYGFVQFENEAAASHALQRLNGKHMPNSNPPRKFKLNVSGAGRRTTGHADFSLFVGGLSEEVDDAMLYRTFNTFFPTVSYAKVVTDTQGVSKGFGFVRFDTEESQQKALIEMQGYKGCGISPLRVSLALSKHREERGGEYGRNYNQYPNYDYQNWSGDYSQYYQNYQNNSQTAAAYGNTQAPTQPTGDMAAAPQQPQVDPADFEEEAHDVVMDKEGINMKIIQRSEEFHTALDDSRWLPLDGLTSSLVETKG
jgi:RNA recognition motif-containing protein